MSAPGPPGFTRRHLLTAVGAAGGAGAVLGALGALGYTDESRRPFDPPSSSDFALRGRSGGVRVVVLGAGVAGLCCAYELGKAGYDVVVLEARQRVGGRCWTVRDGAEVLDVRGGVQRCTFREGRWFNPGPARIAQHHTTMDYCRQLGVPVEVLINLNDAYVSTRGVTRRRRSVQADLDGYISELLVKALSRRALEAEVPASEVGALVDHLRQVGALGRADRGDERVPGIGDDSGIVGSPDELATLLRLDFGARLQLDRDFDQAAPMFHPVGGMDAIATRLADAARGTILLRHRVESVRTTATGVEVVSRDAIGRTELATADVGICTLPPHLAAELESDFDPATVRALGQPQPQITGKLGLEYDRRFWETDHGIYGGITHCHPSIRDIWYPSHGYLGDGGVLVGAYPFGPHADRFSRLDHEARVEMAVAVGEEIHGPAYRDELVSAVSVDWRTQEHSRDAWCAWPRFGADYARLLAGDGNWWFAGDWLARTPGWQHGAFESARRTVTDLHRRVLQTGSAMFRSER